MLAGPRYQWQERSPPKSGGRVVARVPLSRLETVRLLAKGMGVSISIKPAGGGLKGVVIREAPSAGSKRNFITCLKRTLVPAYPGAGLKGDIIFDKGPLPG